jgi:hypothetical protein
MVRSVTPAGRSSGLGVAGAAGHTLWWRQTPRCMVAGGSMISFPKFVTFRASRISRLRWAVPLAEGFESSEHEYLRKASNRDFFYVTAAQADVRTASH